MGIAYRDLMRTLILLLFTALSAFPQVVEIGAKGGVPMTDLLNGSHSPAGLYSTATRRYLVGPTVEFHFPLGFRLEFDAIYRRAGFDSTRNFVDGFSTSQTTANLWEFPVLVKHPLLPGPVQPFIDAGVSIRHVSNVEQAIQTFRAIGSSSSTTSNPAELNNSTNAGFTAGIGLAFHTGIVRVSPEVRYTRWGSEAFRDPVNGLLHTKLNQADFLLGITF